MSDVTPPRALLLGTAGLAPADWAGSYYPDDLPEDWRLGYYANDCDCVLLMPHDWRALDAAAFAEALADTPDGFRCFIATGSGDAAAAAAVAAAVGDPRIVLLVDRADPAVTHLPQWPLDDDDRWCDPQRRRCVVRWWLDDFDLRALRRRADGLDRRAEALIIDGPCGDPGRVGELRTLLELMGRA